MRQTKQKKNRLVVGNASWAKNIPVFNTMRHFKKDIEKAAKIKGE